MKRRGINHYHTFSHLKVSIVDRFNRTLKNWMWTQFSLQGSYNYKWLDMLTNLLRKYINRVHRSTGMKSKQVSANNVDLVYE